jgi:hypothetical protein
MPEAISITEHASEIAAPYGVTPERGVGRTPIKVNRCPGFARDIRVTDVLPSAAPPLKMPITFTGGRGSEGAGGSERALLVKSSYQEMNRACLLYIPKKVETLTTRGDGNPSHPEELRC